MKMTLEQIIALEPCGLHGEDDGKNYTPQRVKRLMGNREFVTPQEIYDHSDVPWPDKYWLLSRLLPERDQHELACRVAETCEIEDDDLRARRDALIQAKRDWVDGKISSDELAANRAATWIANQAAGWAADWAATWAANRAADKAADWAAGWAADWAADYQDFCAIAIELIEAQ